MVRWEATESPGRSATLTPGARLGRYEVLGLLSIGGMAEVYLARVAGLAGFERLVALKRMLPQLALQPDFVEMFLAEARLGAMLDHPNVVQVHDIGEDDGGYYCAMEYVRGADLYQLLRATTRDGAAVPLPFAIEIALGICAGLDHAHGLRNAGGALLGVVHRDVSLSNVLVSYDGIVKVTDFGVAKVTSDGPRTRVGTLKGKIGYMSPEQCLGEPLDPRSDLFAAGIVLYELTTGRRLFAVEHSEYATIQRILGEEPAPPSQLRDGCPPALDAIVMRALERDRQARYQSARELRRDLATLAQVEHLGTTPVELGEYVRELVPPALMRFARAPTERDPVGGCVADRLRTVPMWVGSPSPREADPPARCLVLPPEPPHEPRRRRSRGPLVALLLVAIASGAVAAAMLPRETRVADVAPPRVAAGVAEAEAVAEAEPVAVSAAVSAAVREPGAEPEAVEIVEDAAIDAGVAPRVAQRPARGRDAPRAPARAKPAPTSARGKPAPSTFEPERPTIDPEPHAIEVAPEPHAIEVARNVRRDAAEPPPAEPSPPPAEPSAPSTITATTPVTAPPAAKPARPRAAAITPPRPRAAAPLDARVVLAQLDVRGALPDSEVRRAVQRILPDLRECYRRAARAAGRAPASVLELRFEVDETRAARKIRVGDAPPRDFASCVESAAAKVRTRLPPDVGTASVACDLEFRAMTATATTTSTP